MNRCTVEDLSLALEGSHQVIDVREPVEYHAERIPGTRLVPLSALDRHVESLDRTRALYILCRSGSRARAAAERLLAMGWTEVHVLDGGLLAWTAAGRPVQRAERRVWSLERQVRFAAGLLVFVGVLLSFLVHPAVAALAGLVGAGLMFSAATDTCAMGMVLARMPWNRTSGADQCASGG